MNQEPGDCVASHPGLQGFAVVAVERGRRGRRASSRSAAAGSQRLLIQAEHAARSHGHQPTVTPLRRSHGVIQRPERPGARPADT